MGQMILLKLWYHKISHILFPSLAFFWIMYISMLNRTYFWNRYLLVIEACIRYFSCFRRIIALKWLWKMFFLFRIKRSFRSTDIKVFVFLPSPLFFSVGHCCRGWSNINFKGYYVINCLNKTLRYGITESKDRKWME